MNLLYGFIGANAAVFAYCKYVEIQAQQGFRKPYVEFFKNFTLNFNGVFDGGRYWTLLTSVFTHMSPMHILGNMVSFYYMGRLVAETPGIGPAKLVTLIIGSGLTGSLGYLFNRQQSMQKHHTNIDNRYGLGFSGAVMGVGAAAACMYPTQQFAIYGIIPVPLWVLMGGYFLYDGFYLSSENTRVGHAGHLGGLVFGIAYYFLSIRGGFRRFR
jgi:membrane associated rhomboid family serine protease